ncbi:hypothetical protein L0244_35810 [bacterium]|nr:hypothetical protein [bacterium]
MFSKFETRDFDLLEVTAPSSSALKNEIDNIITGSQKWTAAVECLDAGDGSYRIILQGRLRSPQNLGDAI